MDFINQTYLRDLSVCDTLVDYYKNHPNKYPGCTGGGNIDPSVKRSIDALLEKDAPEARLYLDELVEAMKQYTTKFPYCNNYAPFDIIEGINLQYYPPGGGYYEWHTERTGKATTQRHLVFMTYLNDVEDGGETEFFHQQLKIKPKKGLTLIWPAEWTYTHRGIPSMTEDKYIITGWYSFVD
jgi:hypothetical protein